MEKQNPMREIRIEKLTLNIGAGKDQDVLAKGMKLFTALTGKTPVKTVTNKRIPEWGVRPGLPIGCKITLRKKDAAEMIKRLLDAKSFTLEKGCFDNYGNISFGVHEYIDIKGAKYDPDIGIIGLQACITLERPGFRIKRRRLKSKISKKHIITQQEAIDFMKKNFNVKLGGEEQ